jgi:hypothetical protein
VKGLFFFLILTYQAHAAVDFNDGINPEIAPSGRALAMGNAFTSAVNDAMASFYNPGGLGSIRRGHFHLSNLHMEFNKDWLDVGTEGQLIDIPGNLINSFSLNGTRELLLKNKGMTTYNRFSFVPNFTNRVFSIGYLYNQQAKGRIQKDTTIFEFADRLDHGPYGSINFSFNGGILKFGVTGILLTRKELMDEVDATAEFSPSDDDYKSGTKMVYIAGGRLTLPINMLPTLSITVHNALDVRFDGDQSEGISQIERNTVIGLSITPKIGNRATMHLEVDFRDASNQYENIELSRKISLGAEFGFYNILYFRLGYSDGFGSFGLGLKSKKLEFDLTSYAIDKTASEFRGQEDRRFAISISQGF